MTVYLYFNKPVEERAQNKRYDQADNTVTSSEIVLAPVNGQNLVQALNAPSQSAEPLIPLMSNQDLATKEKDNTVAANAMESFKRGDYENAITLFKELSEKDKSASLKDERFVCVSVKRK